MHHNCFPSNGFVFHDLCAKEIPKWWQRFGESQIFQAHLRKCFIHKLHNCLKRKLWCLSLSQSFCPSLSLSFAALWLDTNHWTHKDKPLTHWCATPHKHATLPNWHVPPLWGDTLWCAPCQHGSQNCPLWPSSGLHPFTMCVAVCAHEIRTVVDIVDNHKTKTDSAQC